MFERAKYVDNSKQHWTSIPDPVGTKKYDGSHDFVVVQSDGSLRFYSRRQSVKGHYPEHTEKLPQLTDRKLPHLAGNVYSVELIHTGKSKDAIENHSRLSGILNSLPPRAQDTQKMLGPVRAVLLDVINPQLPTYRDKLLHLKRVEEAFGNKNLMFAPTPEITKNGIAKLIDSTRRRGEEGIVVTSLDAPEATNRRIKVKHFGTYNLRISGIVQEIDIHGHPKEAMGAVTTVDASGRDAGAVGSGFSKKEREDAFKNPRSWIGRLIQVKAAGVGNRGHLRHPVYNGDADGDLDLVA